MLSYRHGYHAGNFADVVKHITLTLILLSLQRKEKGYCFLDTHAAAGRYDLHAGFAQKNREYDAGIARLWQREDLPEEVAPYFAAVRAANIGRKDLRFYPGSPCIAQHFLRPQDRMALCELHTRETEALKKVFTADRQVTVYQKDGYQALNALLPPRERRGLVLIDPAFELKDESKNFTRALIAAQQRWPTGIFAGWFPIASADMPAQIYRRLMAAGIKKILAFDCSVLPKDSPRVMTGCAMLVINPPWQLDETLRRIAPWLWSVLSIDGAGGYHVQWLVGE